MEAIKIIKDEKDNRRYMQIDLDELAKNGEILEDIYDVIAIELRKDEETVSWDEVKRQLQSVGNL